VTRRFLHKLETRRQAEFGVHVREMRLDGARRDEEPRGEVTVRESVAHEARDVALGYPGEVPVNRRTDSTRLTSWSRLQSSDDSRVPRRQVARRLALPFTRGSCWSKSSVSRSVRLCNTEVPSRARQVGPGDVVLSRGSVRVARARIELRWRARRASRARVKFGLARVRSGAPRP